MNLIPYYKWYNSNTGRVKQIENEIVTINISKNASVLQLPIESCVGFIPEIDDRVLLCIDVDEEKEGFLLKKLTKNRNEK